MVVDYSSKNVKVLNKGNDLKCNIHVDMTKAVGMVVLTFL